MRVSTINLYADVGAACAAAAASERAAAPVPRGLDLRVDALLPAPAYRRSREAPRQRLIAYRRARTARLGPCMRLQFEDLLTVSYQIQEMLRAERIEGAHAMQREIDAYAHLLPDGSHWKATLLIELPDAAERERSLPNIRLAAHRVYVEVGPLRTTAFANEDLAGSRNARHLERRSGVHFLRFALPEAMRAALCAGAGATLGCDSENYPWRQPIPAAVLRHLCGDLRPQVDAVHRLAERTTDTAAPAHAAAPASDFAGPRSEPFERNAA